MTGHEFSVTTLNTNPGIFYETLGEMRTTDVSWKMILYVDVSDVIRASTTLKQTLTTIIKQCDNFPDICESHRQLTLLDNKINKIMSYQSHMDKLIGTTRKPRSPLEFIGKISKILFGTLTTEDLQYVNTAIEHVESKTNDLATLLINQTITTRAQFGELFDITTRLRQQLASLHEIVQREFITLKEDYVRARIYGRIEQITTELDQAILEHEIDLNILIDGILFGKQGIIHPRIISPNHLVKNSRKIKEQIPYAEFPVLIAEEEMDRLVKLSNLHVAYSNNRLIYILHIPLLTTGKYKLYKPIPLPAKQTFDVTKYAIIKSDVEHIGLNEEADSFYEFREGEIEECTILDSLYICPAIFPLRKIRQTTSCNIALLLNKNIKLDHCRITMLELKDTYWKILSTPGNWLFATVNEESIKIECPNSSKQLKINNSGIITIQQGCKIKAATAVMSHPSIRATKFLHHYLPTHNLSIPYLYEPIHKQYEINITEATQEIWPSNNTHFEAALDDIIERAREIKDRRARYSKLVVYNAVACGIGLLGTAIILIGLIFRSSWIPTLTCFVRRLFQRDERNAPSLPPSSAPYKNSVPGSSDSQSANFTPENSDIAAQPIMRRRTSNVSTNTDEGIDVHPAMDRDPAPTDPEVYNRRPPTPATGNCEPNCAHYARPIVLPRNQTVPIANTPVTTALQDAIRILDADTLNNIDTNDKTLAKIQADLMDAEQDDEYDYVMPEPPTVTPVVVTTPQSICTVAPTVAYSQPFPPPVISPPNCSYGNTVYTPARPSTLTNAAQHVSHYVEMQPATSTVGRRTAETRSSHPIPEESRPTTTYSTIVEPSYSRPSTPEPSYQSPTYGNLPTSMINSPITPPSENLSSSRSQRSPPDQRTARQVPVYYRDYVDPRIAPAYSFICHSSWYIQTSDDYILCSECATSDHLFCVRNRQTIMWKHTHFISREHQHTTLHCGRCYKLLMKTRRSIDCYHCRSYVLLNYSMIERISYHLLCDLILPYNNNN